MGYLLINLLKNLTSEELNQYEQLLLKLFSIGSVLNLFEMLSVTYGYYSSVIY